MKFYLLLICSLLPATIGWLSNYTLMVTSIIYWLSIPAVIFICIWFGRKCAMTGWKFLPAFFLTQWLNLLSIPLYIWQFLFTSSEARNMHLAVLAQMPAAPLLPIAFRLVTPFANNDWARAEILSGIIISIVLMGILFTAGFIWGKKNHKTEKD